MPVRNYQLDPGFDAPPSYGLEELQPQPERRGGGLFQFGENWKNMQRDMSQMGANFAAAFDLENDVVNTVQLLTRPTFQADPNFDLEAALKQSDLWDNYRWNFLGVASPEEFAYKAQKIQKEERERRQLLAAGPDGVVAAMIAGMVSPTVFLPFVGPGLKGAKAVAAGLAWGALGGTLQELPLQANQELRTWQDSASSIAMSAVVGGVLGGAVGWLHRPLEAVSEGMAPLPGNRTISPSEEQVLINRRLTELGPETVVSSDGMKHVVSFGETPEEGLVTGFRLKDGSVIAGKPGEPHMSVLDTAGKQVEDAADEGGFVTPQGEYLNREEALAWVQQHEDPNFKDTLGEGVLDQENYLQQIERKRLKARRAEVEANVRQENAANEADKAIASSAIGRGTDIGADILRTDPGRLSSMAGIGERLTRLAGPVTAVLGQDVSAQGRRMMAKLSTAGLRLENNLVLDSKGEVIRAIPSNEGGTVEAFVNSRRGDTLAVIDEAYKNYSDYWFGAGQNSGAFRNSRAATTGFLNRGQDGRLSRRQFFEEVGRAMLSGDVHDIPEVQDTAQTFRRYYDRLLAEAQELGLIPEEIEQVAPDPSFINRVWDIDAINRDPARFLKMLEDHLKQSLQADVSRIHESWVKADQHDQERLADMELPLERAQAMRKQFLAELKALDSKEDDEVGPIEELISDLRASMAQETRARRRLEAQLAETGLDTETRRDLRAQLQQSINARKVYRDEIENLKGLGGADLEARRLRRAELKRRIRNLNRSRYMVEERYRDKYDAIESLEQANIATMERAIAAGQRAIAAMDKVSEGYEKAVDKGLRQLGQALKAVDAMERKIDRFVAKLPNGELSPEDKAALNELRGQKIEVSQAVLDKAEDLEATRNIGAVEGGVLDARAEIQDGLRETVEKLSALNNRRALRMDKLEKQAAKFDKEAWEAKRQEIVERVKTRAEKVKEKIHELGGDDYDQFRYDEKGNRIGYGSGTADFSERARDIAQVAKERVTGANLRLPGFDAMQDARGTELARTLSIPSLIAAREGFLVMDAEHLLHVYAQTLIPDIELTRALGEFTSDGGRNLEFRKLNEEETRVQELYKQGLEDKYRKRVPEERLNKSGANDPLDALTPEERARFEREVNEGANKITAEYKSIRNNLQAVIARIRGTYGLPSNPDSLMYRGAQVALSLNALRFLGTAGISQIPDIAKPIFRYGLGRTLRTAWIPLISNWKAIRMTAGDARRAFVAIESATADRAHQLTELMYRARRRSKFEAGLEWATSKAGILFGFAPVTDLTKTLSAMVFNSKLMDSIDLALNGERTAKDRLEAISWLNSLGLGENLQRKIWNEMQNGGAEKIGDTWVPQTERWTDPAAIRSYRAALYAESAASVVTPGVEIPTWVNAHPALRLFWNLKSFMWASTTKTLMAGLQQRDLAVLNGIIMSLALGAASYYLKSIIAGGETEERMRNATWEQWIDEAVDASGILGVIGFGQQIAGDIPFVNRVSSLSGLAGQQTLRGEAQGLVGDAAGPTYELVYTMAQILTGLDKPTRSQVHHVRTLLPLQNWFLTRRLFDQFENAVGDRFNLAGRAR